MSLLFPDPLLGPILRTTTVVEFIAIIGHALLAACAFATQKHFLFFLPGFFFFFFVMDINQSFAVHAY